MSKIKEASNQANKQASKQTSKQANKHPNSTLQLTRTKLKDVGRQVRHPQQHEGGVPAYIRERLVEETAID